MHLTIDIGNTRSKWALFEGDRLVQCGYMTEGLPPEGAQADIIVCATGNADLHALGLEKKQVQRLTADMPLPITLDYATPETLGPDRIAAACGAWMLREEGCPQLIIDAGTCITIDYLDAAGVYHGGAILPGIDMKFRALHTFTAKLPLLQNDDTYPHPATGRNTQQSMGAGVYAATLFALQGFIGHYRSLDPSTKVVVTGGDASLLWQEGLKNIPDSIIEPHLLLMGLNEIMKKNEE